MIKHVCAVSTNSERGTHGDCFRACIASVLDIESIENVPHFASPDDVDTAIETMQRWLLARGYALAFIGLDGDWPLAAVHEYMRDLNRYVYYILIGETECEMHCAIYRNGKFVHDPAWFTSSIIAPPRNGDWQIVMITYVGK